MPAAVLKVDALQPISGESAVLFPYAFAAQALVAFILSGVTFILLRSARYLAVDGAIRALGVYYNPHPFIHGANHLLYPINVLLWMRFLGLLGISPANAFQFMALAQAMNALAAAACLTIFYLICCGVTSDIILSAFLTIAYGFSAGFLLHATNSAEPMVGLLWSFAAAGTACISLQLNRKMLAFSAGFLLLLGMATYQSMVLIGPAIFLLLLLWPQHHNEDEKKIRWPYAILFVSGCGAWLFSIYPLICHRFGTARTMREILLGLMELTGGKVYGGLTAAKVANLPIGLVQNILPVLPYGYCGLHSLLFPANLTSLPITLLGLLIVLGWFLAVASLTLNRWETLDHHKRVTLFCCGVALAGSVFPLVYWSPLYDKFWLQPLAAIFLACGALLANPGRDETTRRLRASGFVLVALIAGVNMTKALHSSLNPTPFLAEAQKVAQVVQPGDLVVAEWDDISVLYGSFFSRGVETFYVPTEATTYGTQTTARLDRAIRKTIQAGRRVYFLGVLDISEIVWKEFLGDKCGLPYHSFDLYRRCSVLLNILRETSAVSLRRLRDSNECKVQSDRFVHNRTLAAFDE